MAIIEILNCELRRMRMMADTNGQLIDSKISVFSNPTKALAFAYRETRLRREGKNLRLMGNMQSALPVALLSGVFTLMGHSGIANVLRDFMFALFFAYESSGSIVITDDRDFLAASPLIEMDVLRARLEYSLSAIVPMSCGFFVGSAIVHFTVGNVIGDLLQAIAVTMVAVTASSLLCHYRKQRRASLVVGAFVSLNLFRYTGFLNKQFNHLIPLSGAQWIVVSSIGTVALSLVVLVTASQKDPFAESSARTLRRLRLPFLTKLRPGSIALAMASFEEHAGLSLVLGIMIVPLGILLWSSQTWHLITGETFNFRIGTMAFQSTRAIVASSVITGGLISLIGLPVARKLLPGSEVAGYIGERENLKLFPLRDLRMVLSFCFWPVMVGTVLVIASTIFWYSSAGLPGIVGAVSAGLVWILGSPLVTGVAIFGVLVSGQLSLSFLIGRLVLLLAEVLALGISLVALSMSIAAFLIVSLIIGICFCLAGAKLSEWCLRRMLETRT